MRKDRKSKGTRFDVDEMYIFSWGVWFTEETVEPNIQRQFKNKFDFLVPGFVISFYFG